MKGFALLLRLSSTPSKLVHHSAMLQQFGLCSKRLGAEPRLSPQEEASGRIRILGGNVHTDLLDLRIPQISFHSEDNPRDAVAALVTLPEVKAYMQSHGIKFVNAIGGIAPMPKGAHLNTTLRNVTVSEALDRIAQTFPGVWIYSECVTESQRRLVDFTFIEF